MNAMRAFVKPSRNARRVVSMSDSFEETVKKEFEMMRRAKAGEEA